VAALRRPFGVVVLPLALLAVPPAAHGSALLRSGSVVAYGADQGEQNALMVRGAPGVHIFEDPGKVIDTADDDGKPGECVNITPDTATCPALTGDVIAAFLFDRADSAAITTPVPFQVCGGRGADTLTGGDGDDSLNGEGESDTIDGGGGNDFVDAEQPADCGSTQSATPAPNDVDGGPGNDLLIGGKGTDTLRGGPGGDDLAGELVADGVGGDARDMMSGGDGADSLVGYDGPDLLEGGDGSDLLAGGNGDDELRGGDGADGLGVTVNQAFRDVLDGGTGDDLLNAGPGAFVLNLGSGGAIEAFETTDANGADDLVGGTGHDTVSYVNLALPVRASLDGVADDGSQEEGDNVHPDNEVLLGGSEADTLIGGAANDTIDGGKGGDSIGGGDGDDTLAGGELDDGVDGLSGGPGADTLGGGPGDDALRGEAGADALDGGGGADTADGGGDADRVNGGAGLDSLSGGPGDDRLRGAADGLVGADGADVLRGDGGADDLDGGPGDDTLAGGPGADAMAGADGSDIADYQGALGPVAVTLDGAGGDGEAGEGDQIRADVEGVRGGRANDTLTGNAGPNVMAGGGGKDFVDGAGGADTLDGGGGPDAVRSRDRAADVVTCGRKRDFAIADRRDRVGDDCERVDQGGRRRPRLGRSMIVTPTKGSVALRLVGVSRFVPLKDAVAVPLRSSLDAASGGVRVTTARGRRSRQSGTFSRGRFGVRQRRSRRADTELRLEGGDFRSCRGGREIVRTLRGRGRGRFRTRGRHSAARTRRTSWVVEDRCDGTLTRVRRGRAVVRDLRRKRTVVVRAGRSYLARPL
jgi:Ca2+-binding RTX toxin-like protein